MNAEGSPLEAGRMVETTKASIPVKGGGDIADLRCDSMSCMNGKV